MLKSIHKVETPKDDQTSIKLECRNDTNFSHLPKSSLITYFVEDFLMTVLAEKGIYSKWMAELLEKYDAVIFARKEWKGVGFNLF